MKIKGRCLKYRHLFHRSNTLSYGSLDALALGDGGSWGLLSVKVKGFIVVIGLFRIQWEYGLKVGKPNWYQTYKVSKKIIPDIGDVFVSS